MEPYTHVVSLEYRVSKAFEGRYFMGHTPTLTLPQRAAAWAALLNPQGSGINVFVNTFTVSNFSTSPFRAQLWLNAMPEQGEASPYVSATNTAITPLMQPGAVVAYGQGSIGGGQSLFTRVAGAQSTEVGNYYGKIIVPPGGSFLVLLQSPNAAGAQAEAAFGWWEELA
jgi:hypothetical protein